MTYEQKFQEILEFQGMYKNGFSALYLAEEQIDILIEYVWELREQVQELAETNKKNYWVASDFKFENLNLEQQNKRYREVLEFYARKSNFIHTIKGHNILLERSRVDKDGGHKARQALEGEQ